MVSAKQNSHQAHGTQQSYGIYRRDADSISSMRQGSAQQKQPCCFAGISCHTKTSSDADSSGNFTCSNNYFSLLVTHNNTVVKTHMNTLKFFQVLVQTEWTQEPCLSNTPMNFLTKKTSKLSNKAFSRQALPSSTSQWKCLGEQRFSKSWVGILQYIIFHISC